MEELTKEQKISFITAISTFFLAFLAFIGLGFTLLKLIETEFLGYKSTFLIVIFIFLGLISIVFILKGWIKK